MRTSDEDASESAPDITSDSGQTTSSDPGPANDPDADVIDTLQETDSAEEGSTLPTDNTAGRDTTEP